MNRTSLNFYVDLLLFLSMAGLVVTGAIMYFVLPPGTGHFFDLFGYNRHDYGVVHVWFAVAAVLLTLIHLALHWEWVCCVLGKSCGQERPCRASQIKWGIAFAAALTLLLIGLVMWSSMHVKPVDGSHGENGGASFENRDVDRPPVRWRGGRGQRGEGYSTPEEGR